MGTRTRAARARSAFRAVGVSLNFFGCLLLLVLVVLMLLLMLMLLMSLLMLIAMLLFLSCALCVRLLVWG